MKILAWVELGFQSTYEKLRRHGHEVIILDDEVLMADVANIYERERPAVFFWDPGAPIYARFDTVQRIMDLLEHPPTIIFNVMPNEWTAHCSEKHPNIHVVGLGRDDYEDDLRTVLQLKVH